MSVFKAMISWSDPSCFMVNSPPNPLQIHYIPIQFRKQSTILMKSNQNHHIHHSLVVLTILKNISQWEGLSHILWKIKNVWNHQPENHHIHPGWWFQNPSEKYEIVSWDHCSQYMESHKIHVPKHQPVIIFCLAQTLQPPLFKSSRKSPEKPCPDWRHRHLLLRLLRLSLNLLDPTLEASHLAFSHGFRGEMKRKFREFPMRLRDLPLKSR